MFVPWDARVEYTLSSSPPARQALTIERRSTHAVGTLDDMLIIVCIFCGESMVIYITISARIVTVVDAHMLTLIILATG